MREKVEGTIKDAADSLIIESVILVIDLISMDFMIEIEHITICNIIDIITREEETDSLIITIGDHLTIDPEVEAIRIMIIKEA